MSNAINFLTIATATATAAMAYAINAGVKGLLTGLVNTFGIDAGLYIASNGVELGCQATAICAIAAIIAYPTK
jgi:hypothetical protein